MKKIILHMSVLLVAIQSFSQSVSYPAIEKKIDKDIYIKSVAITDFSTQINFVYVNTKPEAHYILLKPPRHKDAYYIKANGQKYLLLSTQNIGNYDGITIVKPGEVLEFSARFEKLPSDITKFDLIEGESGTWDFYGVQLGKLNKSKSSVERFRVDYNYIAIYDTKTNTWGEWKSGDNTFVININENGDIAHLKANGTTVIYKKLSGVEDGFTEKGNHHYQTIKALDEDGDIFIFQIFDDTNIGLKMMWGSFMIQFAKM